MAATLRAHGKTGGDNPTQWWFEYGKTTSYGTKTPQRTAGTSTAQQNVSERVKGLSPDTTYHYRACASNAAGAGCSGDGDLPHRLAGTSARLPGDHRLQQPRGADRRARRARRAHLRGGEAGRHQGLRRARRHDADDVRQPADEGEPLLGPRTARPRARPRLPRQAVRLRALHPRRGDRRHGAEMERRLPRSSGSEHERLRRECPALAPPGPGESDGRRGAGADRGLVPAGADAQHRRPALRAGRRPLRERRRRGEPRLRRLRPERHSAQPLRRPARGGGRRPVPADQRGRRAAQPGPPHDGGPDDASTAPSCA